MGAEARRWSATTRADERLIPTGFSFGGGQVRAPTNDAGGLRQQKVDKR